MVLCDIDRPLTFAHDDGFLSMSLITPADAIALRSRAAAEQPQLLSGARGLGRLVRQLVVTLQEEHA
ncbi:hypothetical protein ACGF0K_09050 [Streptomyces sp. NPDC048156]|uniref:hypothetical protein n=1 Tax=Streptomyces sp. NPDC048156 TaxID=3365502 RepID=UPI00371FC16B